MAGEEELRGLVAPLPPTLSRSNPRALPRRAASVPPPHVAHTSSSMKSAQQRRGHAPTTGAITTESERVIFDEADAAVEDVRLDDTVVGDNPVEFRAFMEAEALLQGGYRAEALALRDGLVAGTDGPNQVDVLEFSAGTGRGHAVVDVVSPNDATPAERRQRAIEKAYHVLDAGGSGHVGAGSLAHGFEMLGLHFTPSEADSIMRRYDKDANGALELAEFSEIINTHLEAPPKLDFRVKSFAPVNWFLLDSIPWGYRKVTFRSHEVAIKHSDGPCGCETLSDDSTVSVEVQKAIHVTVKAGPCAFMHWWVWLTEAMLIFISFATIRALRGNGAPTIWILLAPVGWLTLRVAVQLSRRRATVELRALGNPTPSRAHPAKGDFPVPLEHAANVVDAFLHIKGVRKSDVTHEYVKPIRGFGLLPTAGGKGCCLGYNKLTIGQNHFKIEKLSGGGLGRTAAEVPWLCGKSQQLAGQINVITWVHVHRQGKPLVSHMVNLARLLILVGLILTIVAVFLPKCVDVDPCEQLLGPDYAEVQGTIVEKLRSPRCDADCGVRNCTEQSALCAAPPPDCFGFSDGTCDEPVFCAVGSDPVDCNSTKTAANASGSLLCNYQDDQVCDEPLRCPFSTDTNDCDAESLAENVMDAYTATVRKSSPALADVAAALSNSYNVACSHVRPIERCGGCTGSATSKSCAAGSVGYKTPQELCRELVKVDSIRDVDVFCAKDNFNSVNVGLWGGDYPPCSCMSLWDNFIPDARVIIVDSLIVWAVLASIATVKWWIISRTNIEFGVIGVDNRSPGNIADVRIDHREVDEVTPKLLQYKLGRNLREVEIRHWKRILWASYEKLTLYRDHMHLKTIKKFPFCCHKCSATHSKDEYAVLLKDVHFIETGTDTDPHLRKVGRLSLFAGLALHLSVFLDSFIVQFNAQSDDADDAVEKSDKWFWLIVSIVVFLICYVCAGMLKRDFIHVGVFPDDFSRGASNPWGGHSPFYLQMGMYYISKVNRIEPFDEVVALIRSAQKESRQLDHTEHRDAVLSGEDKGDLKTPPHLGHVEFHPNALLRALQWTLSVKRKARLDADKARARAIVEQETAKADVLAKHMTALQSERAVTNWLRAKNAASFQTTMADIDAFLDEIVELAAGTEDAVEHHKKEMIKDSLKHWTTALDEAKHLKAEQKKRRYMLIEMRMAIHRKNKAKDEEAKAALAAEAASVENKDAHSLFYEIRRANDGFIKSGTLQKLGGRAHETWEARKFELTENTLSWTSLKHASGLTVGEVKSVQAAEDVEGKPSFVVASCVKNNKTFHLIAPTVQERDDWISAIHVMIEGKLRQVKHGTLLKLGGRSKQTWEERVFTVKPSGIVWSAKSTLENTLHSYQMFAVSELDDEEVAAHEEATMVKEDDLPPIGADRDTPNKRVQRRKRATTMTHAPNTAFGVQTNVKGDKLYCFRAYSESERREWIAALDEMITPVEVHKAGLLEKLGGAEQDTWEIRRFEVTNKGIAWERATQLAMDEMIAVKAGEEIGGRASLVIETTVKHGKSYILAAPTVEARDEWIQCLNSNLSVHNINKAKQLEPEPELGPGPEPETEEPETEQELEPMAPGAKTCCDHKGQLMKLGGKPGHRQWEERTFTLTAAGLEWATKEHPPVMVAPVEFLSVRPIETEAHAMEIQTSVKNGKTYILRAESDEQRQQWCDALATLKQQSAPHQSIKDGERKIKLGLRVVDGRHHAIEFQSAKLKLEFKSAKGEETEHNAENLSQAQLLSLALAECFSTFDTTKTGRLDLEELTGALDTLGLSPTDDEIAWLVSEYAEDSDGCLSEVEFVHMMTQYIDAGDHPQLEYTGKSWCPLNILSLDFDFLPWGKKHTAFKAAQIDVSADEGLGGLPLTASVANTSMETEKTRWLHMEGNPAPTWKLNMYFGESLALFTVLTAIPDFSQGLAWFIGSGWWVLRALYFFLRRRGIGQLYTFGNPPPQDGQGRFAVPIRMLDATTEAFLHLKGVSPNDPADDFVKKFPGLGFMPVCCGCYAEHTISLGDKHFKMRRASNNRQNISRGCSRVDYFCGLVEDMNWVAVHKQGKSLRRLIASMYSACVTVVMFLLLVASQTYGSNCISTMGVGVTEWEDFGHVGKTDWCSLWSDNDPLEKPGVPCICMGSSFGFDVEAGLELSCNPLLDPAGYDAAKNARGNGRDWCAQWEGRSENAFTWLIQGDEPCECLWFYERFQWRLLGLIGFVALGISFLGILWIWILITPVWFEVGIFGVNNIKTEHIAAARIGMAHRVSLPLLVLERKLGRQLGGDSSDSKLRSLAHLRTVKKLFPDAPAATGEDEFEDDCEREASDAEACENEFGVKVHKEGAVTVHEDEAKSLSERCCHCLEKKENKASEVVDAFAGDTDYQPNDELWRDDGNPLSPSQLVDHHKKRRDELIRWTYRPLCYRCVRGVREELILHRDFVHLHARSGIPICWCSWKGFCGTKIINSCLKFPVDEEDYYVLLRDTTFIESGTEFSTVLVKVLYVLALVAAVGTLLVIFAFDAECVEESELSPGEDTCFLYDLRMSSSVQAALLSAVVVTWLIGYVVLTKFRRPYIHIGVLPGGGERGRKNPFGGDSPFYVRLPPSRQGMQQFEELVQIIRAAQVESRQADLAETMRGTDKFGHTARSHRLRRRFKTINAAGAAAQLAGANLGFEDEDLDIDGMEARGAGVDIDKDAEDIVQEAGRDKLIGDANRNAAAAAVNGGGGMVSSMGAQTAAQMQGLYQAAMKQAQFSAGVAIEAAAPVLAFTKTFF